MCDRKTSIFPIPKRFKLLGHTIEVITDNARYFERNSLGSCSSEGKWIKLVEPSEHHPITQSSLEHTFFHELVHLCLDSTEQAALSSNENFVDLLAGLLHQALTTAEFE